jgi:methylthioribulose-1-phosphate dehydratase
MVTADASERERATDPAVRALLALAGRASARGWAVATSGNFSVRLDAGRAVVTVSGRDKGALTPDDVVVVDVNGALPAGASAEAPVHAAIYRGLPGVTALVHVHSLAATVVSRRHAEAGYVRLEGLEMLKALRGIGTHEARVDLRVYANTQDMEALARAVARDADALAPSWGFLLAGHGLYAWGTSPDEAWRHAEALEFLLSVRMHEEARR